MARLITKEGMQKLRAELEERKSTIRQEIARAIKEAKEQGDLSENAEYAEAKSQQGENESRIVELEMAIKNSQVVEKSAAGSGVQLGSKVKAKFDGQEMTFEIVGSNEADPGSFKISNESPLGKAFMGHAKGEEVEVNTPRGTLKYAIVSVE